MQIKTDIWRPEPWDILAALGLLTRLPVKIDTDRAQNRGAAMVWAFPLVGLCLGAFVVLTGLVTRWIGLPPLAIGCAMVGTGIIVTGAMHEDGFADTLDGLWGGWTRERRLEIMKDSSVGVYGLCGLVLVLIAKSALLVHLLNHAPWAIIGVAILSRSTMPALMLWLPNARDVGLSKSVGRPPQQSVWTSLVIGGVFGLGLLGVWPVIFAAAAALGLAAIAKVKIGGQTGDILGASQIVTELAALCLVASLI